MTETQKLIEVIQGMRKLRFARYRDGHLSHLPLAFLLKKLNEEIMKLEYQVSPTAYKDRFYKEPQPWLEYVPLTLYKLLAKILILHHD